MLRGDGDPLLSLALSPDGRTLAVAENDGTVRFFDAATRRPVGRPYDAGKTRIPELGYSPDSELEYSPDGTRLAVADASFPVGGFIDLLDGAHAPQDQAPQRRRLAQAAVAPRPRSRT